MANRITVGDVRKAIKGMKNSDPVKLDMADPPEESNWVIDGIGNYGGTLQFSVSDHALLYGDYGDDDDDDDDDDEYSHLSKRQVEKIRKVYIEVLMAGDGGDNTMSKSEATQTAKDETDVGFMLQQCGWPDRELVERFGFDPDEE